MRGLGRVARWDSDPDRDADLGAVIVDGLPAEVRVPQGVVETPDGRDLQPGELVEIEYSLDNAGGPGGGYRATRVCPTNG